jgi:hypothetical protein
MELLQFLNKALWISAIVFAVYWLVKYLYEKFKPNDLAFFYFKAVIKNDGEWKVKIESPADDFEVEINVLYEQSIVCTKKARLKAGLNSVSVKSPTFRSSGEAIIKIQSSDQKLERTV